MDELDLIDNDTLISVLMKRFDAAIFCGKNYRNGTEADVSLAAVSTNWVGDHHTCCGLAHDAANRIISHWQLPQPNVVDDDSRE